MIKLSKGAFLRLRRTTGKTVTALRAGEQFTLSRPGLTILEALTDASVSVDS